MNEAAGRPTGARTGRRLFLLMLCGLACACSGGAEPDHAGEVRRILGDDRYEWLTIETDNTRVHFPRSSYAASRGDELPERAERARGSALAALGMLEYPRPLHLFYVDTREDMANLTGRPVTGFSYSADAAIVVVFNEGWRPFEAHELTHVVTLSTWPEPGGPAVVEGLAALADGVCGGYPNGRLARTILDRGEIIPFDVLVRDFRRQDDLVAYLEAASVVEFVLDRRGHEAIPDLWARGLASAPEVLGLSSETFEGEWSEWLIQRYDSVSGPAWEAIDSGGCGIDAASEEGAISTG